VTATCFGENVPPSALRNPVGAERDLDAQTQALNAFLLHGSPKLVPVALPSASWVRLLDGPNQTLFGHRSDAPRFDQFVRIERQGALWKLGSWGMAGSSSDCTAQGVHHVDPVAPILPWYAVSAPTLTTVDVQYAGSCASPIFDRADVTETATSVTITIHIREFHFPPPSAGIAYGCPSISYPGSHGVALSEPLGSRQLFDGYYVPAAAPDRTHVYGY
jgi:hypothetical protein